MKSRCLNQSVPHYGRYGGRGIGVCDDWISFEPFRDWALANGYRDDLSIDRVDTNGDYEPGNCRWATLTTQARNARTNVRYPFRGQNLTIPEIAEIVGMDKQTLWRRVKASGMPLEEAVSRPLRKRATHHSF